MADDDKLRAELKKLGYDAGPVTDQTRALYKRKLEQLKKEAPSSSANSLGQQAKVSPSRGKSAGKESIKEAGRLFSNGHTHEDDQEISTTSATFSRMEIDTTEMPQREDDSMHVALKELQGELARWKHRCATAEQQLMQLQQQTSGEDSSHLEELGRDLLRTLDQPMVVSDVCFILADGESVLACRSLLAMRCPEMVDELWLPDEFAIVAQTLTGNQCQVGVRRDHSVRAVKELLAAHQGTPVSEQRLVYQNTELDDSKRLIEYGITQMCVIHLVVRQRPESGHSPQSGGASAAPRRAPLVCVVELSDITKVSLISFLSFLYSGTVFLSPDSVCGVYVLCRRFKVQALRRRALEFIQQNLSADNVWPLLRLSHQQCTDELKVVCLNFIAQYNALGEVVKELPDIAQQLLEFWERRCK